MDQTLPSARGYSRQQPQNQHQHHQQQQQQGPLLFPSSQLPSPSQLHPRLALTSLPTLPNLNLPPGRYDNQQQQQQQQQLWSPHRTSSSRDELHPGHQHQHQQPQPQPHQPHQHQHQQQPNHQQLQPQQQQPQNSLPVAIKRESIGHTVMHPKDTGAGTSNNTGTNTASSSRVSLDDAMPSTSDFVKKLYKMLEDPSFQPVVSWGPQGDCFVVKDMNEFTKSILPRMFKHSNFASFVRQLNKYDFHKVKNTDDMMQYGEQSWTFRHPDFHADRRESLENIKRKVPAQRKQQPQAATSVPPPSTSAPIGSHHHHSRRHSRRHRSRSPSYSHSHSHSHSYSRSSSPASPHQIQVQDLHAQIASLQLQLRTRETRERELEERIRRLERGQGEMLQGLVGVQRGMAMQDGMVRGLVGGWVGLDGQGTEGKPQLQLQPQASTGLGGLDVDPGQGSQHSTLTPPALANANPTNSNPAPGSTPNLNSSSSSNHLGQGPLQASRPQNQQYAPFLPVIPGGSAGLDLDLGLGLGEGVGVGVGVGVGTDVDVSKPEEVARASLVRVGEFSRQQGSRRVDGKRALRGQEREEEQEQETVMQTLAPPSQEEWAQLGMAMGAGGGGGGGTSGGEEHEGLQVYTVGHLMPRTVVPGSGSGSGSSSGSSTGGGGGDWSFDAQPEAGGMYTFGSESSTGGDGQQQQQQQSTALMSQSQSQKLRVRRSTFVPGWAVPPRVLLVDDDAVIRKLSSKFLQVFGCTIDVAVDGIGAVNKMNLDKYDLVLMDIVMPKLDGISATSLIRKFDRMTPIISMTSNSKPDEIVSYYRSGMDDILPKPFTKEGLFDVLEKHLTHLKVIQEHIRASSVPRSVGIPPLCDASFEAAFTAGTTPSTSTSSMDLVSTPAPMSMSMSMPVPSPSPLGFDMEDDGRINPLAGMGLTDEQYNMILQNIVNGEGFMGGVEGVVAGVRGGNDGGGGGMGMEKRMLEFDPDDLQGSGRETKRSRFEVIE